MQAPDTLPTVLDDAPSNHAPRPATIFLVALILLVAGLRFYHATRMLTNTADLIRHLYYGVLVNQVGFSAAGRPLDSFPSLAGVTWSWIPYNYPVVTLGFFSAAAAAWPTIFCAKLALTLIEAVNALLVWRFTRSRWLGALYWAAPVSIWWVSREGQFEPLQNLFVLSALCVLQLAASNTNHRSSFRIPGEKSRWDFETVLRIAPACAFALLALGIQVKLSALFLLPFFVFWAHQNRIRLFACLLGFLAGLLPTILALRAYPVLNAISDNLAALHYNPYHWNPFDLSWRGWVPTWLALANGMATYTALGLLAWGIARPRPGWDKVAYLAPLIFLIAIKSHANVQFWYMILWPSFILPIPERGLRWALFLLYPLMDLTSMLALAGYPMGPLNPAAYAQLSVFGSFR